MLLVYFRLPCWLIFKTKFKFYFKKLTLTFLKKFSGPGPLSKIMNFNNFCWCCAYMLNNAN